MKTIILLPSLLDTFENLERDQVAEFVIQLNRWRKGEDISFDDPLLQGLWMGVKFQYEEMKLKYSTKCEKNRENGKKGGRPTETQPNPNNPDGFIKSEITQMGLKEKEKEKEKEVVLHVELQFLIEMFNTPHYSTTNIKKLWNELSQEDRKYAFERADNYIKWETQRGKKKPTLEYYLKDKKWGYDLTIKEEKRKFDVPDVNTPERLEWYRKNYPQYGL